MKPIIKINLQERLSNSSKVIIELGCGINKPAGRIGVDIVDTPGVDIVADIDEGLPFLPTNSVDQVHCASVLEHLNNFEMIIQEITRILKPNGTAHIFVPHFSNPHFYSDYTHKRAFGLYTFYYFVDKKDQLRRKVPDFYSNLRIEISKVKLVFKSAYKIPGTTWKLQRPVKWLSEWLFNLCSIFQEYYEENLCYLLPCKGIEVTFRPKSFGNEENE